MVRVGFYPWCSGVLVSRDENNQPWCRGWKGGAPAVGSGALVSRPCDRLRLCVQLCSERNRCKALRDHWFVPLILANTKLGR